MGWRIWSAALPHGCGRPSRRRPRCCLCPHCSGAGQTAPPKPLRAPAGRRSAGLASLSHIGTTFGSVGADHTASVIQKAAAVIAVAAVAGGGGYAAHKAGAPLPLTKGKESKSSPSQPDAANNLLAPASDRTATDKPAPGELGGRGVAPGAVTAPGSPATGLAPGSGPNPGSVGPLEGSNGNAEAVPGAGRPARWAKPQAASRGSHRSGATRRRPPRARRLRWTSPRSRRRT